MRYFVLLFALVISTTTFSQGIRGIISDYTGEGLPFAVAYIQGTTTGTSSNIDGNYELALKAGSYTIEFSYVGYKKEQREITITDKWIDLNMQLQPAAYDLTAIVVRPGDVDPAYAIIKNAQRMRTTYQSAADNYKVSTYVKGNQRLIEAPDKIFGQEVGDMGGMLDTSGNGIIYLSESESTLYYQKPNQYKEIMISSRVSGNDNGFSFNQARAMNFSFYENRLDLNRQIISPIANGAMTFYDYKWLGVTLEDGKTINKIQVIPKRQYDPVFSGVIYITEDTWAIHSLDLITTKEATKIPVVDTLRMLQTHVEAAPNIWLMQTNTIRFKGSAFGFKFDGDFVAIFRDYEVNTTLDDISFNNEIFKIEEGSNEKSEEYWSEVRPIPITVEEQADYIKKDSLSTIWESKEYLDSIDAKSNRFKFINLIGGYSYNRSYKKFYVSFPSPLTTLQFNPVQGYHATLGGTLTKYFDQNSHQRFETSAALNYGFSDKQIRGKVSAKYRSNRVNYSEIGIEGGRLARQFEASEPITPTINTLFSLIGKRNLMRLYDSRYGQITYGQYVNPSIHLRTYLNYSRDEQLDNTTNQSWLNKEDLYIPNRPGALPTFYSNRAQLGLQVQIRPKTKYMSMPKRRIMMGSKWPTLTLRSTFNHQTIHWLTNNRKSVFATVEAQLNDQQSFGLVGRLNWLVQAGTTFNDKDNEPIAFAYYKHFRVNDYWLTKGNNLLTTFQLVDDNSLSTDGFYLQAHVEHHFDGFIWNKLPGLKKLGFQVVAAGHYVYTPVNFSGPSTLLEHYGEMSIGIENIGFKLIRPLRIDYVRSFSTVGWNFKTSDGQNGVRVSLDLPF